MSKINQDELFQHLSGFLKSKGIELQNGSYSARIRKGCGLLTDTINLTQETLGRAKSTVDAKLDQVRQAIHEKTAPKRGDRPRSGSGSPGRKAGGTAKKPGPKKASIRKERAQKADGAGGGSPRRRKV